LRLPWARNAFSTPKSAFAGLAEAKLTRVPPLATSHPMKLYGLTGGIASGKSTVAAMFRRLGTPVIDADQIARDLVVPKSPLLTQIGVRWPGAISSDGTLDRAWLGRRVFEQPEERLALETLLHPAIQREVAHRAALLAEQAVPWALYDAALILENGLDRDLEGVVLVSASPETQVHRLEERNGFSTEQAWSRIRSQMPLSEKLAKADLVIDNDGSLQDTQRRVREVWETLSGETP
jgi:dephospho-CoA kinase